MRDVFYTLLVVWLVWRVVTAFSNSKSKASSNSSTNSAQQQRRTTGATTVDYVPPKKKSIGDDEGEYVDFEEVK